MSCGQPQGTPCARDLDQSPSSLDTGVTGPGWSSSTVKAAAHWILFSRSGSPSAPRGPQPGEHHLCHPLE